MIRKYCRQHKKDRQCTYNVILKRVHATTAAVEKHILSVFVALGIQHAMTLRYIFICDLPGSTVFFPHYLINGTIFEEN